MKAYLRFFSIELIGIGLANILIHLLFCQSFNTKKSCLMSFYAFWFPCEFEIFIINIIRDISASRNRCRCSHSLPASTKFSENICGSCSTHFASRRWVARTETSYRYFPVSERRSTSPIPNATLMKDNCSFSDIFFALNNDTFLSVRGPDITQNIRAYLACVRCLTKNFRYFCFILFSNLFFRWSQLWPTATADKRLAMRAIRMDFAMKIQFRSSDHVISTFLRFCNFYLDVFFVFRNIIYRNG